MSIKIREALTFDDVLLVPKESDIFHKRCKLCEENGRIISSLEC